MYRIAAVGDKDSIYGFASLGLETIEFDQVENKSERFKEICSQNFAVIYITEALASELEKEIDHFSEQQTPAIILIPGVKGNTGKGIANVKRSVEQAVGSDIIFND